MKNALLFGLVEWRGLTTGGELWALKVRARTHKVTKHIYVYCDNCKYEATITINLKAHKVTKHEGSSALKFMYHILFNYGTHSYLFDPSLISTQICV